MKNSLSHRWRIAVAASLVAGLLFALVLFGALEAMAGMERRAAEDLLDAPMSEVTNSVRSGEPLDEEVGAQERVTVVVFDSQGRSSFRSGTAPVGKWSGSGQVSTGGQDLVYRSTKIGKLTVVAASDLTSAHARLSRLRLLFLALLTPLAGSVGVAAYVAAGLMYRPLRTLTSAAREMAANGHVHLLPNPKDPDFSPLVQELNGLLARIQAEMDRQERLVTDVAHDLRTPLTVIRGKLETALLRGETAKFPEAMRTAIRETERLSGMAEAILQIGDQNAEVPPLELAPLTGEIVARWQEVFDQKGARLTATFEPCCAAIAPEEWTSVLDNLLDNAFKYGGTKCTVSLSSGEEVLLKVTDNGKGIPLSERERVFERFTRLDSSRGSAGHGLGLYLCASILGSRGGTIFIDPAASELSVRVTVPLVIAAQKLWKDG